LDTPSCMKRNRHAIED